MCTVSEILIYGDDEPLLAAYIVVKAGKYFCPSVLCAHLDVEKLVGALAIDASIFRYPGFGMKALRSARIMIVYCL